MTFEIAKLVFRDPFAIEDEDWDLDSGEPRYEIIGMARERLLFVAYTMRGARIRIVRCANALRAA